MIDSQTSASRPRNLRVAPRRANAVRRSAPQHSEVPEVGRWKVQLELAPSEIAFVYRKGLARGAEVCRRGTQEWRPLVTTPELRDALAKRASLAEMIEVSPAMTLSQVLTINDPSLAELFLQRRSSQLPKTVPPPPPAILRSSPPAQLAAEAGMLGVLPPLLPLPATLARRVLTRSEPPMMAFSASAELGSPTPKGLMRGSIPDAEVTPLLPLRLGSLRLPQFSPARLARALVERKAVHARPFELSVTAAVAIALTLVVTAVTLRIEAPRMNELISSVRHAQPEVQAAAPVALASDPGPASSIPVVPVHDLPVEGGRVQVQANSVGARRASGAEQITSSHPDRASLSRALGGAAAAARRCGGGHVRAQAVVTYAPSGVARDVHFVPPLPAALHSCVYRAVAGSHIAPFMGEAITVSKTLRW